MPAVPAFRRSTSSPRPAGPVVRSWSRERASRCVDADRDPGEAVSKQIYHRESVLGRGEPPAVLRPEVVVEHGVCAAARGLNIDADVASAHVALLNVTACADLNGFQPLLDHSCSLRLSPGLGLDLMDCCQDIRDPIQQHVALIRRDLAEGVGKVVPHKLEERP